ncbi:MAG: hypothetical protein FD156_432 [Nitrospirae bacterium]|nr:MAG: hypothetical protein FD156_432 [Nitrospirota bacterium]
MSADFFIDQASVYTNGLLAATTSKLLATCLIAKGQKTNIDIVLGSENEIILENARHFLTNILNGQQFISGKTKQVAPSVEGIIAFNYAIQTIESIGKEKRPSDVAGLLLFFEEILSVLDKLSESKLADIAEDNLNMTNQFFARLADVFLDKVQTFSRSEAKIFQAM